MPAVSLNIFADEMRGRLLAFMRDKDTLSPEEFEAKYPTPPTPAEERAERRRFAKTIADNGGNPIEVWTRGYCGMGPTVPSYIGTADATTFEAAVAELDPNGDWAAHEGPLFDSEEAAWAAHDAHWHGLGPGAAANDSRRPPKKGTDQ